MANDSVWGNAEGKESLSPLTRKRLILARGIQPDCVCLVRQLQHITNRQNKA